MPERIFCVRAGKAGKYADSFVQGGYVAIGWNDVVALYEAGSRDEIKSKLSEAYPEYSPGELGQSTGEIKRFILDIQRDDFVLTVSADGRTFVGKVLREPPYLVTDDDACPYIHRRSVEWLEQGMRANLPNPVQQSLANHRFTVFEVEGDTSWVEDVRWDKFIEQARAYLATGKLEEDELKYKTEIGRKLAAARGAVVSGAEGWERMVKTGISNNLIFSMTQVDLRNWMDQDPDHARDALIGLWGAFPETIEHIRQFRSSLPRRLRGPGTCANIASVLLMGLDAEQFPPYRLKVFEQAYSRTGFSQPENGADSSDLYEHCLSFLDRFIQEANRREVHIHNRLEAQSVVWAIVQGDEFEASSLTRGQTLLDLARNELYFSDASFLEEIASLLDEKRQVIFQGPPGTGKTFVARTLAKHFAGSDSRLTLVQFHPSYSYEDFVQGYRPIRLNNGQLGFELRDGPLKRLAEKALRAEEEPNSRHFLIIDEINRGNLGKIFGELYFLLEYRDQNIRLQYSSGDDELFRLPGNLYIIGTMNTARPVNRSGGPSATAPIFLRRFHYHRRAN